MVTVLVLGACLSLQLLLVTATDFNPTKYSYCSAGCLNEDDGTVFMHTACKCNKLEGNRTLISDDIVSFRKTIVEIHNKLRNKLASGGETKNGFPNAANMRVINYDLELEYIANCYAKVIYTGHDKCNRKHNSEYNSGQNIAGSTEKRDDIYVDQVNSWYSEIENVVNPATFIESFALEGHAKPKKMIGHFSQVVWAETSLMGCARVWIPKNPKDHRYASVLICNYAGDDGCGGNVETESVYKAGKPASQCPDGTKRNDKYTSLCGTLEAIPELKPYKKGGNPVHDKDEL
ncbi:venom allergen 5-like [Asbolus verrucosus]|uniref:Venom allergen 5-like n=1 Tax=Asbolus verrucosus TaxID=1661398 RepID=A0A482VT76_ASBVE|nr:venom allergen 5-like [Asbolus verrucosus]